MKDARQLLDNTQSTTPPQEREDISLVAEKPTRDGVKEAVGEVLTQGENIAAAFTLKISQSDNLQESLKKRSREALDRKIAEYEEAEKRRKEGKLQENNLVLIKKPSLIIAHQRAIQSTLSMATNNKGEDLFEVCVRMLSDNKIQYVQDEYGAAGVYFPELKIVQRIAYLSGDKMREGIIEDGGRYHRMSAEDVIVGMPKEETHAKMYKITLEDKVFKEALKEDGKGYRRKTLTDVYTMLEYIAQGTELPFVKNSAGAKATVVLAYMYFTGAIGEEWLNTDWVSGENGDEFGRVAGKSIPTRAIISCNNFLRIGGRSKSEDSGVVPLVRDIA